MMRRMSVFPQPGTSLGNLGLTANEIQQEVENSKFYTSDVFCENSTKYKNIVRQKLLGTNKMYCFDSICSYL